VVAALYRRYRPETFQELIGQAQVTDPLRTALRTDRVGHAYLFSGPRGCGKTTSARILARCLNCVEGPTDTPCGKCPSCVELSRGGGGSLDVVEIDAASHNGVDDARDLRERAVFAPARDRYKIFILDEAHMVTPQGFNALLKIVEEPPEHVKFIFATTEPEKVIGTIRSRTHHYPFRLVPPAQLLEYVAQLCASEGIGVEPGVLPLVVRAGGGSVRDTLSLLDQLIAGSEGPTISYERAVALLGYTHDALLDAVIGALAARDAPATFAAVDRVVQTGQDPRRFVEDLLERLRDLLIVAASPSGAASLLRGVPQDQLDAMAKQASVLGSAALSSAADAVNAALTEMVGATSPRLQLELLVARLLVGLGAERAASVPPQPVAEESPPAAEEPRPQEAVPVVEEAPVGGRLETPGLRRPSDGRLETTPARSLAPPTAEQLRDSWPEILGVLERTRKTAWIVAERAQVRAFDGDVLALGFPTQGDIDAFKPQSEHLRAAIQEVVGVRVKFTAKAESAVTSQVPVVEEAPAGGRGPTPPRAAGSETPAASAPRPASPDEPPPDPAGWDVAPIPDSDPAPPIPVVEEPAGGGRLETTPPTPVVEEPAGGGRLETTPTSPVVEEAPEAGRLETPGLRRPSDGRLETTPTPSSGHRPEYGEAVVRGLLGARFIGEHPIEPPSEPGPA